MSSKAWWLAGAGLVALTAVLYARVVGFEFLDLDDTKYVTLNQNVQGGLSMSSLHWALTTTYYGMWHPVTWLSHLLDVSLFGSWAGGHHLSSALLHCVNTALVCLVLKRLEVKLLPALIIAGLFALHPTRVESVAWVAERRDVLSVGFFVGLVLTWLWYRALPSPSRFAAVLVVFVLAIASKPLTVTAPVLLLVLEAWRAKVPLKSLVAPLGVMLSVSATASVSVFIAQRATGAFQSLSQLSLVDRIKTIPLAYMMYLGNSLFPVNLSAYVPRTEPSLVEWLVPWVAGVVVLVALFIARRHVPQLGLGVLWFIVALSPTVGLLQFGGHFIANRYLSVAQLGLFSSIVLSIPFEALRRWAALAVALVLGCAALTSAQLSAWKDSETLFRATLEVQESAFIQTSLGLWLLKTGRAEQALEPLSAAAPKYDFGQSVFGLALVESGREQEGFRQLEAAHQRSPDDRGITENLTRTLGQRAAAAANRGDGARALVLLDRALAIAPGEANLKALRAQIAKDFPTAATPAPGDLAK